MHYPADIVVSIWIFFYLFIYVLIYLFTGFCTYRTKFMSDYYGIMGHADLLGLGVFCYGPVCDCVHVFIIIVFIVISCTRFDFY